MDCSIRKYILTFSLLLAVVPHSLILTFVHVGVDAISMLDVVHVFAIVDSTVYPVEHAYAVHLTFFPLSFESVSVGPSERTFSMDDVVCPFATILTAVSSYELTFAIFLALFKIAVIS